MDDCLDVTVPILSYRQPDKNSCGHGLTYLRETFKTVLKIWKAPDK